MFSLYQIGIHLFILAFRVAALFNVKAKLAMNGRRQTKLMPNPHPDETYIWFHCASLGEFEQGRPLMELIRKQNPASKILLTFFSPSGYEIQKKSSCADVIVYLPFDTKKNAKYFLEKFKIKLAVFVKYEIWPNIIAQLFKYSVPVYITSAVFRPSHWYFRWYGRFAKNLLAKVRVIFTQDVNSLKVLQGNGLNNGLLSGDSRIDRVIQIKNSIQPMDRVERFLNHHSSVVLGSIYKSDSVVYLPLLASLSKEIKIIIAPHQVDEQTIQFFQRSFENHVLWSNTYDIDSNHRVLIVDNVGNLNRIYQYASVVYIGGGFDKNIHNILEPAVFQVPVCFGPMHHKFHEAASLINQGLAFSSTQPTDVVEYICKSLILKEDIGFKNQSNQWFQQHSGATQLIYNRLSESI